MKIPNSSASTVDVEVLQKISEDTKLQREKDNEWTRLFDRFFPEFDLEVEKRIMDKAYEDIEDDLYGNF